MAQALYRRYRPETFEHVIGQEHVTGPLQQALRTGRVSHAYLFSGPRGCGKTTSARILARCLNCTGTGDAPSDGPTATPCGTCDSCVALARDGAGSLDVVEIDAASHGGVDDARDLRERAFYAPASSRFKVYVIDEAHMVTPNGFNALLKIVEEPPAHVVFVFATTEPEKVIGTIRSRTHHYPFRLVPPQQLHDHLAGVCEQEGVAVERGVLSMVVRAGRGSVRDAMSVLDQLVAGSGPEGLTCELTTSLLGYTDASLLDDTIEAFAAADGAGVFGIIDRVVEAGHDPRRFTEDLLERLRDLLVLDAIGGRASAVLRDAPDDQVERMRQQASRFGSAGLSRAADLVNVGLTEMRGATAPRLLLELIAARVLLPSAEDDPRSLQARFERLERRLSIGAGVPQSARAATSPAVGAPSRDPEPPVVVALARAARTEPSPTESSPTESSPTAPEPAREPVPADQRPAPQATRADPEPRTGPPEPAAPPPGEASPPTGSGIDATALRRLWPDVVEHVRGMRRVTWTLISQYAAVVDVDAQRLLLGFSNANVRNNFDNGAHPELVRQAVITVVGVDLRVEAIVDPSAGSPPAPEPRPESRPVDDGWGEPTEVPPGVPAGQAGPADPGAAGTRDPAAGAAAGARAAARTASAGSSTSPGRRGAAASPGESATDDPRHGTSTDDDDVDVELTGTELVQRELGARVIREEAGG